VPAFLIAVCSKTFQYFIRSPFLDIGAYGLITHYLDNFVDGWPTSDLYMLSQPENYQWKHLGVPLAMEKVEGSLESLGILLDTKNMEACDK